MVAAALLLLVGSNHHPPPVAAHKQLGSAGGHGARGSDAQRGEPQLAADTLSLAWLRGGSGRGAGASPAGFRDQMERLDDVNAGAQPSGVTPPAHERSHENAHAQVLRIAWQVVGCFQRLLHESIPSICSLSH